MKSIGSGRILGLLTPLMFSVLAWPAPPSGIQAKVQAVSDRKIAPSFNLDDAAGKTIRLSDYRNQVVLLDFWATECGGCVREIPGFIELAEAYKKRGLATVGVSVDILYENLKDAAEAWRRVNPFVQSHRVDYPIIMGNDQVTKSYDIHSLPLTCLIDRSGRIAAVYQGVVDKANIESNIEQLLKEPLRH